MDRARTGDVLIIYEPVNAEEAAGVERNLRAALAEYCLEVHWESWRYDPESLRLTVAASLTTETVDRTVTGLSVLAWDAVGHFCKVLVSLDTAVWERWFHRVGEAEYQFYREHARQAGRMKQAEK